MVKRENGEFVGIQCDKCAVMAPPSAEIRENMGLVNMGWHVSGGTHICPAHDHPANAWPRVGTLPVLSAGGRGAG